MQIVIYIYTPVPRYMRSDITSYSVNTFWGQGYVQTTTQNHNLATIFHQKDIKTLPQDDISCNRAVMIISSFFSSVNDILWCFAGGPELDIRRLGNLANDSNKICAITVNLQAIQSAHSFCTLRMPHTTRNFLAYKKGLVEIGV